MQDPQLARHRSSPSVGVASLVFLTLGLVSVILFHSEVYFPILASVTLIALLVFYFLLQVKAERISVFMVILLSVYLLPFVHIPFYVWFDFNSNPKVLWGLAVNPYMLDEEVIRLTAMLGATGGLGMAFAISLTRSRLIRDNRLNRDSTRRKIRGLSTPIWLVWLVIGVGFSWISAPQETIFTARYTMSESIHGDMNFSSAWMISYVILTFAFIDALIDRDPTRRAIKSKLVLAAIAYVVVGLQLLRGDRESIPWVFALAIVYFYWTSAFRSRKKNGKFPWFRVFAWVFVLLLVSTVVGAVRHHLVGVNVSNTLAVVHSVFSEETSRLTNMLHGTWSATLLTPLSVAGDHINNLLAIKWGQDYWDLFLSLPPGFMADAISYERPLDSGGPALDMRYGIGGTHASVVPFMNFRMAGVFLIPALWSYILLRYERIAVRRVSVINLTLLATIVMASPHWLWYGEKYGINAIIIWLILAFFYRVSLALSRKSCLGFTRTDMAANAND